MQHQPKNQPALAASCAASAPWCALAVSAGFCTVIFFALTSDRAPSEYSKSAVETVCGLQLEDN